MRGDESSIKSGIIRGGAAERCHSGAACARAGRRNMSPAAPLQRVYGDPASCLSFFFSSNPVRWCGAIRAAQRWIESYAVAQNIQCSHCAALHTLANSTSSTRRRTRTEGESTA